jgi:hypothetical protein
MSHGVLLLDEVPELAALLDAEQAEAARAALAVPLL